MRRTHHGIRGSITFGVLVAVVATLCVAGPAHAQVPGANGRVGFLNENAIYSVNPDGTGEREIVTAGYIESFEWSPDGNKIVFTASTAGTDTNATEVFVINADGTGLTQLTDDGIQKQRPSWSPDGTRIAFAETPARSNQSLVTIAADGSDEQVLDTTDGVLGSTWSPDGTSILYERGRLQNDEGLWSIPAAGGTPTQVTGNGADYEPDFSPDGSSIIFTRTYFLSGYLVIANADGTNQRTIPTKDANVGHPRFSPDGTRLLFQQTGPDGYSGRLYSTALDGSDATVIGTSTASGYSDGSGEWQAVTAATAPLSGSAPGTATATVLHGGTVSSGSVPTADAPVQTTITAPNEVNGTVSITPRATTTTPPAGFTLFDKEIAIDAPAATTADPYRVDFTIAASELGGVDPTAVQVLRNGVPLQDCVNAVTDSPDPCVVSRSASGDSSTDATVEVLTSHFSTWSFGTGTVVQNRPPTADNVSVSTTKNTKVATTLVGSDPDGGTISYSVLTQPAHGTLSGTAPNLTYQPANGYTGTDSFTYSVSDGTATSPTATVTITVAGVNHVPVAHSALVLTKSGKSVAITLRGTDADGDALTYTHGNAAHGTVTGSGRTLTYTPASGFTGLDGFTYTVNDGKATSAKCTIVVLVTPNHRPVAGGQKVTAIGGKATAITLDGFDADGDPLTYSFGRASHGVVTVSGRTATYTAAKGYIGADSFNFTVSDGSLKSNPATVSITVKAR